MSEIKFSDGMPVRERRSDADIYPEELLDKKCGGCVRCKPRERKGETGYHCTTQPYTKDISPEDKTGSYDTPESVAGGIKVLKGYAEMIRESVVFQMPADSEVEV